MMNRTEKGVSGMGQLQKYKKCQDPFVFQRMTHAQYSNGKTRANLQGRMLRVFPKGVDGVLNNERSDEKTTLYSQRPQGIFGIPERKPFHSECIGDNAHGSVNFKMKLVCQFSGSQIVGQENTSDHSGREANTRGFSWMQTGFDTGIANWIMNSFGFFFKDHIRPVFDRDGDFIGSPRGFVENYLWNINPREVFKDFKPIDLPQMDQGTCINDDCYHIRGPRTGLAEPLPVDPGLFLALQGLKVEGPSGGIIFSSGRNAVRSLKTVWKYLFEPLQQLLDQASRAAFLRAFQVAPLWWGSWSIP